MNWRKMTTRSRLISLVVLTALFGLLLSGCSGGSSSNGPVDITYTYLNESHTDQKAVEDALNKILVPSIGVHVTLKPLGWSDFETKVRLGFTAGKSCDVVWTATWMNNYYQNVINGNFLSLDDLLPQYAPNLKASLPNAIWQAARFKGHIYGVINQQIFATQTGFFVRQDLADKYHLNLDSIKTYQDLEPFLQQIKEHEPNVVPILNDGSIATTLLMDQIGNGAGVRFDDTSHKVVSIYESPEYRQSVELVRKWYQKGYLKDPDSQGFQNYDNGKYAIITGSTIKPGGETEFEHGHPNYKIYQHSILPPVITTGGAIGTMNAICRSSKHPQEAMKFLEALNSNVALYNTLAYGVESKDWVWKDKAHNLITTPPPGVDPSKPAYATYGPWMFGNTFNAYYTTQEQVGSWDATKALNSKATLSPILGFNFDTTAVRTETASVSAAITDSITPINQGLVDPTTALPKAIQNLKAAGLDKIISETQHQVDEWGKGK